MDVRQQEPDDDEELLDRVPNRYRELAKKPKSEKIVSSEWRGEWC